MRVTEHFSLEEFERSETAEKLGINNHVPPHFFLNIEALCTHVLEPVREHFGKPVRITSGYRSPELNAVVDGAANPPSQHTRGEAADIVVDDTPLIDVFEFITENLRFDQCILEPSWVHVSYSNRHNRMEKLRKTATGYERTA